VPGGQRWSREGEKNSRGSGQLLRAYECVINFTQNRVIGLVIKS